MALLSGIVYNNPESLLGLWRRRYNRTVGPIRGPRYTLRRSSFRENEGLVDIIAPWDPAVGRGKLREGSLSWGIFRLTPLSKLFPAGNRGARLAQIAAFPVKWISDTRGTNMQCTDEASGPSFDKATVGGKQTSRKWHKKGPTLPLAKHQQNLSSMGGARTTPKSVEFKRNEGLLPVSRARSRAPSQRESPLESPNYLFDFKLKEVGVLLVHYWIRGSEVNAISLEYAREFGYGHPSY